MRLAGGIMAEPSREQSLQAQVDEEALKEGLRTFMRSNFDFPRITWDSFEIPEFRESSFIIQVEGRYISDLDWVRNQTYESLRKASIIRHWYSTRQEGPPPREELVGEFQLAADILNTYSAILETKRKKLEARIDHLQHRILDLRDRERRADG